MTPLSFLSRAPLALHRPVTDLTRERTFSQLCGAGVGVCISENALPGTRIGWGDPLRLAAAKRFGADITINVSDRSDDDVAREVRALAPPDGVDAVIEVCGNPIVLPLGLKLLRVGGRYTLGGIVTPEANITLDANMFVKKWITLRGIHNYHPRHLIQALDFVVTNRDQFPFKDIVDSKFQLNDLNEAFKRASERSVLRAAVIP